MPLYQELLFYILSWKSRQPAGQGAGLTKGSVSSSHFDPMDKVGYLDHICNHRLATLRYCFQCQPINSSPYVQSEQQCVCCDLDKAQKSNNLKGKWKNPIGRRGIILTDQTKNGIFIQAREVAYRKIPNKGSAISIGR